MTKTFIILIAITTMTTIAQAQSSVSEGGALHRAAGTFDVKIAPLAAYNQEDKTLGRFSIDKQFHGGLEATSKGEMLSAGNPASSGGYVAIERITGTLDGRAGSFVLQHNATMEDGQPHMNIIVVPGFGTGQLTGIAGKMEIIIDKGKHSFIFEYML